MKDTTQAPVHIQTTGLVTDAINNIRISPWDTVNNGAQWVVRTCFSWVMLFLAVSSIIGCLLFGAMTVERFFEANTPVSMTSHSSMIEGEATAIEPELPLLEPSVESNEG